MNVFGARFEDVSAENTVVGDGTEFTGRDEIDGVVILQQGNVGSIFDGFNEGGGNFTTGGVLGVEDAALGVATFLAEGKSVGVFLVFVKIGAPVDEFRNGFGSFLDDGADGVYVAEAGASIQSVGDVLFAVVAEVAEIWRENGRNSSLGPSGVGLKDLSFGDDGNGAVLSGLDRERESGDAGADNEKITHVKALPCQGMPAWQRVLFS